MGIEQIVDGLPHLRADDFREHAGAPIERWLPFHAGKVEDSG
ncbi:MAG: hypothetical protein V4673_06905 [Pseudomonadota bacterium]